MLYQINNLSDDEQRLQNHAELNVLQTSPFVLSIDEGIKGLSSYFINKFFAYDVNDTNKDDNEFLSYIPFNILLNRIDFSNYLYEYVCHYVYNQAKDSEYNLRYFIDTMIRCNRIIPTNIINDLDRSNKVDFYKEAKIFDDRIRTETASNGTFKNTSREGKDDNNVFYMIGDIFKNNPLTIDYRKLRRQELINPKLRNRYCSSRLLDCFIEHFAFENVFFHVAYSRLYHELNHIELNELISIVETNIINSKNKKYAALYMFLSSTLSFFDDEKNTSDKLVYDKWDHLKFFKLSEFARTMF